MVRISDVRITGPAAAAVTERPNRTGSAEISVRVYEPDTAQFRGGGAPWGTLVWAHGGSFVRGTLDWPEADWASRRFADTGLRVYSVDYVLASDDVKAPAPANDVAAVLREVRASHPGPVFVGGASAGAHVAVLAALAQAELAAATGVAAIRPSGLALVYPTLHRVQRADTAIAALTAKLPEARQFGAKRIAEMYEFYLGEDQPASVGAVVAGELPAERLASLPPTVIVNAEADDLRASAEQFAEQLRSAGVSVTERVQPETVHGYLNRPDESAQAGTDARATIGSIVRGLRAILEQKQCDATIAVKRESRIAMEPELTEAVSLTLPNGRLNRAAVGWTTQPIVDTSGIARGRGRNKRWEYWNIATPTHIVGLTVSHIDYACVPEIWVYDRATGESRGAAATVIPPRGTVMASTLEQGRSMTRAKNLSIDIDEVLSGEAAGGGGAGSVTGVGAVRGTRLRMAMPGVSLDVVAALPERHERLAVVVPWSDTKFQYTVKDLARPATGWLRIGGVEHEVGGASGEAWAVLDHGRGRWPYDINWNWGAGSGRSALAGGRVIGVQVGAKWTEGTGVSENAFFVDGHMHKIHGEVEWRYSVEGERWREPWRVTGGGLDATFVPFHNKRTRTDLVVLQGHTDQCFGEWSGSFVTADGETIEFDGLIGWAEEVHNRW